MRFEDRSQAGQLLSEKLQHLRGRKDVLILALPRGGVPVAFEIAKKLMLPLDVLIVRKLGVPGHEELAMGAIASGGARFLSREIISYAGISEQEVAQVELREQIEIERREQEYRPGKPPIDVRNRTVVLVDDGLATGATMMASIRALRGESPKELIVAIPVAPPDTWAAISEEADSVICLHMPEPFGGVGLWYRDFSQTTDSEVRDLLARAASILTVAAREGTCNHVVS